MGILLLTLGLQIAKETLNATRSSALAVLPAAVAALFVAVRVALTHRSRRRAATDAQELVAWPRMSRRTSGPRRGTGLGAGDGAPAD